MKISENMEFEKLSLTNQNNHSKSADVKRMHDVIRNLNEEFIIRKSQEYNFDFLKACSYDKVSQLDNFYFDKNSANRHLTEKSEQLSGVGRKAFNSIENNIESKMHNLNLLKKKHTNQNPNINIFSRNSNASDAIKKLKEKLQGNKEFSETKNKNNNGNNNYNKINAPDTACIMLGQLDFENSGVIYE